MPIKGGKTVIGAGPHRSWQRTKIHKEPDNEPLQEGFLSLPIQKMIYPFLGRGYLDDRLKTIVQI